MFTPNGQLFVDNTSGILKFKIDKMQFTGNTLREALNHYRNYKHLPELTGRPPPPRAHGSTTMRRPLGRERRGLTPARVTLRRTIPRPPPPLPPRRATAAPPPADTITLNTIEPASPPPAAASTIAPASTPPAAARTTARTQALSRQELYPISPANPAPASTLPAALSLQPFTNAILKGLPQLMPTRLPITVSAQTPATTYAKGSTVPRYMRSTLSKNARNAATLRNHSGSMAKTQRRKH